MFKTDEEVMVNITKKSPSSLSTAQSILCNFCSPAPQTCLHFLHPLSVTEYLLNMTSLPPL